MSAKAERVSPLIVAIVVAALTIAVMLVFEIDLPKLSVAAGTLTFGIVVAGFAATQRNMLLGMGGSRVLRFAVRTGYHKDILDYLVHCIYAGLFVSVVSLVGFFIDDKSPLFIVWLSALAGSISLVLTLVWRNERMMVLIVKRFIEEQGDNSTKQVK